MCLHVLAPQLQIIHNITSYYIYVFFPLPLDSIYVFLVCKSYLLYLRCVIHHREDLHQAWVLDYCCPA